MRNYGISQMRSTARIVMICPNCGQENSEFAETLRRWQDEGVRSVALVIGGPDGLVLLGRAVVQRVVDHERPGVGGRSAPVQEEPTFAGSRRPSPR